LHEFSDDLELDIGLLLAFAQVVEVFEWWSLLVGVARDQVFASGGDLVEQTVNGHDDLTVLRCLLQSVVCVLFVVFGEL